MKNVRLNTLEQQIMANTPAKKSVSLSSLPRKRAYTLHSQSQLADKQSPSGNLHRKSGSKLVGSSTLKLSPIKQWDETKLNISSERWLVYDYRVHKYKRGWKPADSGEFSGINRLLILRVFIELCKADQKIKDLQVRVNVLYLKQEIELAKQRKLSPAKKMGMVRQEAISRALQDNMIINIVDLLYGLLLTAHDDLVQYSIIFVGYLCYCNLHLVTPNYHSHHHIDRISEAKAYADYFAQFANDHLFGELGLQDSRLVGDGYLLQSCPNDICKLYLSIESSALFKSIAMCGEHKAKIKYQLGYNFWQNPTLTFRNKRPQLGNNSYQFICCWKGKRNYSAVIKNKDMDILIVLQECKFGMLEPDVRAIEGWVRDVRKPIGGEATDLRKGKVLAPLLKMSEVVPPVGTLKRQQIKRINTQLPSSTDH